MNVDQKDDIKITIRVMEPGDIKLVARIEDEVFPDPWPIHIIAEHINDENADGLVVLCEEKVIAYACYTIEVEILHLTNLAVDIDFRRKSVAKRLLEHILSLAIGKGCQSIVLEVRPSNREALTFYEKSGFEELYLSKGYYTNPPEDGLIMLRNL